MSVMVDEDKLQPLPSKEERGRKRRWRRGAEGRQREETIPRGVSSSYTFRKGGRAIQQKV